jgi:hypothetical protein
MQRGGNHVHAFYAHQPARYHTGDPDNQTDMIFRKDDYGKTLFQNKSLKFIICFELSVVFLSPGLLRWL